MAASNFTLLDEQRQAVDEAVSDVLRGWLESGRMDPPKFQVPQNGHGLTREELRDLLVMAIHRFDPTERPIALDADRWGQPGRHADARLCGLAAAKLARLNADDGLWEQAEVAALKFADAFPEGCSRDVVNTFLQIEIVDLLNETREHEKAFRIANGFADTVRPALAGGTELKDNLLDSRIAMGRAGNSALWAGNRAAALDLYRESLDICRQIVERFGEAPQSLSDVVISRVRMSQVEPESARGHLTEAKTIADLLAERNWLTAAHRGWPDDLARRLSDLIDSDKD